MFNGKENGKKGEGEALPLSRLPTDVFMCRIRVSVKEREREQDSERESLTLPPHRVSPSVPPL